MGAEVKGRGDRTGLCVCIEARGSEGEGGGGKGVKGGGGDGVSPPQLWHRQSATVGDGSSLCHMATHQHTHHRQSTAT